VKRLQQLVFWQSRGERKAVFVLEEFDDERKRGTEELQLWLIKSRVLRSLSCGRGGALAATKARRSGLRVRPFSSFQEVSRRHTQLNVRARIYWPESRFARDGAGVLKAAHAEPASGTKSVTFPETRD